MNIIVGVGGQVGSKVATLLESRGLYVRRVFHSAPKQAISQAANSEIAIADYFDEASLKKAFHGGDMA